MAVADAFHVAVTQQPMDGGAPFDFGTKIELEPGPAIYAPGAGAELSRLFPEGLTQHGKTYMTTTPADASAWSSWAIELFFEAVRFGEFDDRPSRMQSVFGFASVADAETFVGGFRAGQPCAIYRIQGEVAHRANMSLLQVNALPGAVPFGLARSYWLGEQGPRPPLWELLLRPPVEFVELVEPIVA